jgi:hypothetical protein
MTHSELGDWLKKKKGGQSLVMHQAADGTVRVECTSTHWLAIHELLQAGLRQLCHMADKEIVGYGPERTRD